MHFHLKAEVRSRNPQQMHFLSGVVRSGFPSTMNTCLFCTLKSFSVYFQNSIYEHAKLCFSWLFRPSSHPTTLASLVPFIFEFATCLFVCFLGPHLWHVEVLRLEVESELQLPIYTPATAMQDPSCICNLHHSSWQCWFLNPLSEARDQTCILMDTSWVHNPLIHNGNSCLFFFVCLFVFLIKVDIIDSLCLYRSNHGTLLPRIHFSGWMEGLFFSFLFVGDDCLDKT